MTAMDLALEEARAAAARGEVPVGAVVLGPNGTLLARAGNAIEARPRKCGTRSMSMTCASLRM